MSGTILSLPPRRLVKDHRLNTWLFNRRLAAGWSYPCSRDIGFYEVLYPTGKREHRYPWRRFKNRLKAEGNQTWLCCVIVEGWSPCQLARLQVSYEDPNRDQRHLRDLTTQDWMNKRRAQAIILKKDHHIFEFYFILYESGRW